MAIDKSLKAIRKMLFHCFTRRKGVVVRNGRSSLCYKYCNGFVTGNVRELCVNKPTHCVTFQKPYFHERGANYNIIVLDRITRALFLRAQFLFSETPCFNRTVTRNITRVLTVDRSNFRQF
jgi:hypothetical protein